MEGGYAQWQKEVMEEAHKAVLKRKGVHGDKIIPVPDKIRDCNTIATYANKCHYGSVG